MGNNYREVDLTANALINVGAIHESPESNISTYSVNSNSATLYEFESDTIGNITNVSGADLNWNGRRLESISVGGTDLISYKYNIDGQRISKTYDGVTTEYFYNGDILAGQKKGNDTIVFMYDNNGDIFGFTYNGTPYYYAKNAQNDVFLILDQNGQPVVLYFYDAWGNITTCLDGSDVGLASINPITYRSYYMDVELGFFMYYLNSRYYVADFGRFVSADSYVQTGQGMLDKNMFAYCANNPVMFRDPSGCSYEITIPAIGDSGWYEITQPTDDIKDIGVVYNDGTYTVAPVIDVTKDLNKAMKNNAIEIQNYAENHNDIELMLYFTNKVGPNGDWDYKVQLQSNQQYRYNDMILRFDDIGNIHYGYVGSAIYSEKTLLIAAGVVQLVVNPNPNYNSSTYFDEPRDQEMIAYGHLLWDTEGL